MVRCLAVSRNITQKGEVLLHGRFELHTENEELSPKTESGNSVQSRVKEKNQESKGKKGGVNSNMDTRRLEPSLVLRAPGTAATANEPTMWYNKKFVSSTSVSVSTSASTSLMRMAQCWQRCAPRSMTRREKKKKSIGLAHSIA